MKDYFEHIEDYLYGRLGEPDQQAFQDELSRNTSLQKAVDNFTDGKKISEALLEIDMLQTLEQIGTGKTPHTTDKNRSSIKYALAAVSLLILCGLFYFWNNHTANDPYAEQKQWFANNYVKPVDPDATKSTDTLEMDALQKGKYFFSLNRYEESKNLLINLRQNTTNSDTLERVEFWLQHCYMNLGEWEKVENKYME